MTALREEVIAAHGGEEAWRNAGTIRARVRTGGLLPRTRMPGNRLADYEVTVEPGRPYAVLDPFPRAGLRGVFEGTGARIEDSGGRVVEERADPRAAFTGAGAIRRALRWDPLDSTYFAGYAMWNYLTMPLLLCRDDVEVRAGLEWTPPGESAPWRSLEVTFPDPASFATHSREQTFWFDDRGLEVRHDYTAEVVGGWAKAAHDCSAHVEVAGLVFPGRRRVHPRRRNLRSLPLPTLVSVDLSEIRLGGLP